jgi:hypothetical protein
MLILHYLINGNCKKSKLNWESNELQASRRFLKRIFVLLRRRIGGDEDVSIFRTAVNHAVQSCRAYLL